MKDMSYLTTITASHYGINQRLKSLLADLENGGTSDRVGSLRRIMLDDLWFYSRAGEDAERALIDLLGLLEALLEKEQAPAEHFRLLANLTDFLLNLGSMAAGAPPDGAEEATVCPPVLLAAALDLLEKRLNAENPMLIRASNLMKKLIPLFEPPQVPEDLHRRYTLLLRRSLTANLDFWTHCLDTGPWYSKFSLHMDGEYADLVFSLDRTLLGEIRDRLGGEGQPGQPEKAGDLAAIDDYNAVRERLTGLLERFDGAKDKVFFLFFLLELEGLKESRDYLLWSLNHQLRRLELTEPADDLQFFLQELFACFDNLKEEQMGPVLACLPAAAEPFYRTNNQKQIDHFIDSVIRFGFVSPSSKGIGRDWELRTDPNHLKCLRAWLAIYERSPAAGNRLIAALIINLRISGIFIADTDLFQKDVSRLLNNAPGGSYILIKQLCRIFPVYYNAIGADGELRALTTEIDSLAEGRDLLVHFLRKQVHVDSNPTQIALIEEMLRFYAGGDPETLAERLPVDVRAWLDPENPDIVFLRRMTVYLCRTLECDPGELPALEEASILSALENLPNPPALRERRRLLGLLRIHALLVEKYTLSDKTLPDLLRNLNLLSPGRVRELQEMLADDDVEPAINQLLRLAGELKTIIRSSEVSEGHEDIYYKRHIAAGIPSMYGSYRERKFEALGVLFRVENLLTRLLGRLISGIELSYVTAKSLRKTARVLSMFNQALILNEIFSREFDNNLEMFRYSLTTTSFSMEQYINLFQFLAGSVKEIIKKHFLKPFNASLEIIGSRELRRVQKQQPASQDFTRELFKQAEVFYRELLASSFPMQQLDQFISRVLATMRSMSENLSAADLQALMGYDPDVISAPMEPATPKTDNRIFLGAKGYYLKKLTNYGFPIPAGFILTTELHRLRTAIRRHPRILDSVFEIIRRRLEDLEQSTGKKLGDPRRPLLLSVRSGAPLSMPGAMSTFLNIGLNDRITASLARQRRYAWAAWDCYRRLLQSWGMTFGLPRERFDHTMLEFKKQHGIELKARFSADQMHKLALTYRELLKTSGIAFEEDPWQQLIQAIIAVNDSWFSSRAMVYRRHLGIAEKWGTAVIIQQMVLGNLSRSSGSGVFFTREPREEEEKISIYGDFSIRTQGEDVVAGLVYTLPVSEHQNRELPVPRETTLESAFPEIYTALKAKAEELIRRRGYSHQEIEFTFESGRAEDLYILQSRKYAPRRTDSLPVFTNTDLDAVRVGSGMGIGGGALNGIAVFTREDLERFAEDKQTLILIRPDTVPDTIDMIFRCDGLLTARGGITSHAAVTAVNLGKTCVVNCQDLRFDTPGRGCSIGEVRFEAGDPIGIDGQSGCIYRGNHPIGAEEHLG